MLGSYTRVFTVCISEISTVTHASMTQVSLTFQVFGTRICKKNFANDCKPSPYNGRRPFADIEFCITFVNYQSCVYR